MMDKSSADIKTHRLSEAEIEANFRDLHAPLARPEALIEADRCYFCFDAPCTNACPTTIDIPRFIQQIRSGNIKGSARTILSENIMGGMCARVCPTEVLCEDACVRHTHEDQPVRIGLLQRFATDPVIAGGLQLFQRRADTGKRIAVVGGGPAGLSCAHRLACLGHEVTVLNAAAKPGGLNEYGIAAYKTVDDFAQREVEYLLGIGGILVRNNTSLGVDFQLSDLRRDYDAVFLGFGLGGVNDLGLDNDRIEGVVDAVEYIARLRQAAHKSDLPVGRKVLVIGGGMTAIDIALQSKRLGAEEVTIAYRRGRQNMSASQYEQELAQTGGVNIRHWLAPRRLLLHGNRVGAVEFERTTLDAAGRLCGSGDGCVLEADVVFKAIGQRLLWDSLGEAAELLEIDGGKIVVDEQRKTSLPDVWAGGDCVAGGEDLTVSAVQDGKLAAIDIDRFLLKYPGVANG
jgi:glutamate synthase (NADPH/NADH) small chain